MGCSGSEVPSPPHVPKRAGGSCFSTTLGDSHFVITSKKTRHIDSIAKIADRCEMPDSLPKIQRDRLFGHTLTFSTSVSLWNS